MCSFHHRGHKYNGHKQEFASDKKKMPYRLQTIENYHRMDFYLNRLIWTMAHTDINIDNKKKYVGVYNDT